MEVGLEVCRHCIPGLKHIDIKNYINPDGTQHRIYAGTLALENDIDNPYWIINKDKLTSQTKRITGGINGNFKITNWWDVTGRLGYDQYATNDYTYIAPGSAVSSALSERTFEQRPG